MAHNPPLIGNDAAPFFAEGTKSAPEARLIEWELSPEITALPNGGRLEIWKGNVPGVKRAGARVKHIVHTDREWYRWIVGLPDLRIDGFARSEREAFEMVTRAAGTLPAWVRQVGEFRKNEAPRLTQRQRQLYDAVEKLVGQPPRRTSSGFWALKATEVESSVAWVNNVHAVRALITAMNEEVE